MDGMTSVTIILLLGVTSLLAIFAFWMLRLATPTTHDKSALLSERDVFKYSHVLLVEFLFALIVVFLFTGSYYLKAINHTLLNQAEQHQQSQPLSERQDADLSGPTL